MSIKKLRVQPKFTRAIKMNDMQHKLKIDLILPKSKMKHYNVFGLLGIYYPRVVKNNGFEEDLN